MKKIIVYLVTIISISFMFNKFIYAYKDYKIGDSVIYNDILFYVIKNSNSDSNYVTLLKAEPLTVDEVNLYGGVGTENNRVNINQNAKASDDHGYGAMAYYANENCKYGNESGCTTNYNDSDIKYVIDGWANDKINTKDLVVDSKGYKTRIMEIDDLLDLGMEISSKRGTDMNLEVTEYVPSWAFSSSYNCYWSMSAYDDHSNNVWDICSFKNSHSVRIYEDIHVIRPVINIKKDNISYDIESSIEDLYNVDNDTSRNNIDKSNNNSDSKSNSTYVQVADTLKKMSSIFIIIGITIVFVCAFIFYRKTKIFNKK